jgi:ZIP family zinc transporter
MSNVVLAMLIGAFSALPLVIGAWIALKRSPSNLVVGFVSAFGAGALISAIAFDLVLDASEHGSPGTLGAALAVGAISYFLGSEYLDRRSKVGGTGVRGLSLLLGATLDGIPESFILGISVAAGAGAGLPFLVAVFVSNLPEGMASAAELKADPNYTARHILGMWVLVVCLSAVATGAGAYAGTQLTTVGPLSQAFAAGALLTMLTDDLIPEARDRAGIGTGLAAVFGFSVAFALHQLGA